MKRRRIMGEKREKKKILIVDDDEDFVTIERTILESEGFDVEVAFNGQQCIKMIPEAKPDVILMDVMMNTEYEGAETTKFLREHELIKNIPVIVVTSKPLASLYPDQLWTWSERFVFKPVEKDKLLEKINDALKER